jgi:hypothetical protein
MSLYIHPGGQATVLPPPEGWVSDFKNPTVNPWVYATYWTMGFLTPLTLIFVGQKLYCQIVLRKRWQWDDSFLVLSLGFVIATMVFLLRGFAQKRAGIHTWELEFPVPFTDFRLVLYPVSWLYPLCALTAKTSLLISYLWLNGERKYRYLCYFGIFFVAGSNFGLAMAAMFPCQPLTMAWDSTITEGRCIDFVSQYKSVAIIGLLSDVILLLIPIPMALNLQMPWQQKAGLIGLFIIGGITILTSAVRLYVIITQIDLPDQAWGIGPAAYWLLLEGHLALWCATLTSVRMFVKHVAPRVIGENSSRFKKSESKKDQSRASPLVTFGSKPINRSRKYDRFDTEYAMETIVDSSSHAEDENGVANASDGDFIQQDDNSEKAIV